MRASRISLAAVLLVALLTVLGCGKTSSDGRAQTTATWSQRVVSGLSPSPRSPACVVFDRDRGRMLLFGGFTGDTSNGTGVDYNDLWSFDPKANAWTELEPASSPPPAGNGCAGVYAARAKELLLYDLASDNSQPGSTSSLWAYDTKSDGWTELHASGDRPPTLGLPAAAYDVRGGRMFLFGGQTDLLQESNDLYAYNPASNNWQKIDVKGTRPAGRHGEALVYDSDTDRLLMFGGISDKYVQSPESGVAPEQTSYRDTWAFDLKSVSWTELKPAGKVLGPSEPAAVYDPALKSVVSYTAGVGPDGHLEAQLQVYDSRENAWTTLPQAADWPSARWNPALLLDPGSSSILLYGGQQVVSKSETTSGGVVGTPLGDIWDCRLR